MPWGNGEDRLAVSTYTELGEVIAFGDPGVRDQERADAGRETVAGRSRALLPENRRRAAERYAAGPGAGLDDGEEAVRVWCPRDPAVLRTRLGEDTLAVWAEDDVLHVLWCGRAERAGLGGGIQPTLWPVPGCDDLWEASLRIRGLARAVISVVVFAQGPDGLPLGMAAAAQTVWRGPQAPPVLPVAEPAAGTVEEHAFDSTWLGGRRGVTVYRPPVPPGPLPGCVVADGGSVPGFTRVLEPAILAGAVPAVLLVGVHHAADPGRAGIDGRTREYLPGQDRARFAAHLRLVTEEVIPWATDRWDAAPGPWTATGCSNGAGWAIAAAQRRPDLFSTVAAFSAGVVPGRISTAARNAGVRHYLGNGTLEPGFRRATRDWADRLRRAHLPYQHEEWIGGHDYHWWQERFPAALGRLLAPSAR